MDHDAIAPFFTRSDGSYLFARWGRPIAPVVFGVEDKTLATIKGAIEAVVVLADHRLTDMDPELGANLLMFFFTDWRELIDTPDLDRLVPDLAQLVDRLEAEGANTYRLFRFDAAGAIKAVFAFIRMDAAMGDVPAEDIALSQAAQCLLLWSDTTLAGRGILARAGDTVVLHPDIAMIIRAAYDPTMPTVAKDASHALRLAARIGVLNDR